MSALKIVFLAGDRQIVLYGQGMKQMWQVETHVLERLGEEERLKLETAQFRKFWIDEEGDRVEIMNDVDYDFFLKRGTVGHKTPKIYFEAFYPSSAQQSEQPQSSTSSPQQRKENLCVHRTVECDVCKTAPLCGFRYKCLQCPNFDLCMKCEGEMKHPEHLMLRIPTTDSATMEAVCPITTIFGNKRRQRKYAAAAAAAAAGANVPCAEGVQAEGKSRHHRHHRRHCGNGTGGAGIWYNFYDMMQDLAEGGVAPQDSAATESPQKQQQQQQEATAPPTQAPTTAAGAEGNATAAAAATANSQSKETNTPPDRSSTSAAGAQSASAPPSFENLQNLIDPHFMKAGIQILNNFSEMFGKILDPVVTVDVNRSTPDSVIVDIDLTGGSASATPPPTASETPKTAASKVASTNGSGIVTPMETEVSPPSPIAIATDELPRSRTSLSEENDWTMVDNNVSTTIDATAAAAAAAVAAVSPPLDFAKLSQQLQSHIENEIKEQAQTKTASVTSAAMPATTVPSIPSPAPILVPTPALIPAPTLVPTPAPVQVSTPVATTTTPDSTERRAIAVFHPDPRINSSVHAMMAMGFSNEGAMLTQLLESVNGSIPLAIDLMSAAQRN